MVRTEATPATWTIESLLKGLDTTIEALDLSAGLARRGEIDRLPPARRRQAVARLFTDVREALQKARDIIAGNPMPADAPAPPTAPEKLLQVAGSVAYRLGAAEAVLKEIQNRNRALRLEIESGVFGTASPEDLLKLLLLSVRAADSAAEEGLELVDQARQLAGFVTFAAEQIHDITGILDAARGIETSPPMLKDGPDLKVIEGGSGDVELT